MKKSLALVASVLFGSTFVFAQELDYKIDNWYPKTKEARVQFEPKKSIETSFEKVKVNLGGAFALQFQALSHKNKAVYIPIDDPNGGPLKVNKNKLYNIGNNFNLATANLDLNVALYDGIFMHLRTFLSSRHHPEPYVKGGYIQIDKLNFISEDFLKDIMDYTTIKVGHDEINYGDAHFRRSDNASAIVNPFVGNLLMDSYATFVFAEFYYQRNNVLAMLGVTNNKLNQHASKGTDPSIYGKLGYDNQINDDLRLRVTGSYYSVAKTQRTDFYTGDRAGSRYYFVMENQFATSAGQAQSGRVNPNFENKLTAFMVNPFVKFKGFEFFGTYEHATGLNLYRGAGVKDSPKDKRRKFDQYAAELIYRFGNSENFYLGGRYNYVEGKTVEENNVDITRYNLGAGWFMTNNILIKGEYVNQKYKGFDMKNILHGGEFDGVVLEAVISF